MNYPNPPFPQQPQRMPGPMGKMTPMPDHGETSCKGSGRLTGWHRHPGKQRQHSRPHSNRSRIFRTKIGISPSRSTSTSELCPPRYEFSDGLVREVDALVDHPRGPGARLIPPAGRVVDPEAAGAAVRAGGLGAGIEPGCPAENRLLTVEIFLLTPS